ncbi:Putative Galactose-binding-like domain superfamily, xaa-Pro dipeptidyl-peptidase [Colletotrichum destructivum]|uniref:Galactose-binding-like domain superfamily, xaa-Pro dipeptidyl-peptidase n=1 Tax=Colletotrichum destructivum TaxID=34406 RepID=A0AAX4J3L9_9PEZI|nr:Putative Galactose-binding-like domain superfamily, xaa-Pro dipeptidyl-peptidase [Colletotrichum destructivum]
MHRPGDDYPLTTTGYHTFYFSAENNNLSLQTPKEHATSSYRANKWEEDRVQLLLLVPNTLKLFMSTDDNDDRDVCVIMRKLDVDGNVPLNLIIDNLKLYKRNGPAARLCASKRALGQDSMLSEEQRKQKIPNELWLPYDKEEKVQSGTIVELNIPVWHTCIAFEAGESMRLEVNGHDYRLHEWADLGPLENPNEGTHTAHTGEDYPSQMVLPLNI